MLETDPCGMRAVTVNPLRVRLRVALVSVTVIVTSLGRCEGGVSLSFHDRGPKFVGGGVGGARDASAAVRRPRRTEGKLAEGKLSFPLAVGFSMGK